MRNIKIKIVSGIMFIVLYCASAAANICINIQLPENPNYFFNDNIEINSYDGTAIAGNLFVPKINKPPQGFPAIIFVNSWVVDEHEYLIQAAQFANKGYLVFSYSSRGWGCSGGQVDVVGGNDMQDLSAIIDWLTSSQEIDAENIGISGISYGSGISLMGLAKEPRLKTAVAMSTWGSLTDSLYQNKSPRLFWGFFLVSSGYLTANLDPIIAQNYFDLIFQNNIEDVITWSEARSVNNSVNLINQRNAPVYLANNFGDNLFQPNNLLNFYAQLTVPKRLDLNQGTHATGEGFGLVGLDNFTWNNTHRWFDYWLKNEDNGIMQQPPVTMLTRSPASENYYQRNEFEDWPSNQTEQKEFYLAARGLFTNGKLSEYAYSPLWPKTNTIVSGLDTLASTGIPVLSALLDGHLETPVKTYLPWISRHNGIVFESDTLTEALKIRGIPKINLKIKASYPKIQLNAYLYDVSNNMGRLITHGPVTLLGADTSNTLTVDWELVATAYDIPAGHKLAIAFDTFDILYAAPTVVPYSVQFKFSRDLESKLTLTVQK